MPENTLPGEKDRPRLPEGLGLTDEEREVARRFFAGEATIEELGPVIEAQIQRLIDTGQISVIRSGNRGGGEQ